MDIRVAITIKESAVYDRGPQNVIAAASQIQREHLSGNRPGKNANVVPFSVFRELLCAEAPNFGLVTTTRETIGYTEPAIDVLAGVAGLIRELIVRQPKIGASSVLYEILVEGSPNPIIEQVGASFNLATSAIDILPPSLVLSDMRNGIVSCKVVQAYAEGVAPWSQTAVTQSQVNVVVGLSAAFDQSMTAVSSAISNAVISAPYPPITELVSAITAGQAVTLVVLSTEVPYIPATGVYVPQFFNSAVISAAEPMPLSKMRLNFTAVAAVSAFVSPLPVSTTRVGGSLVNVVQSAEYDGFPSMPAQAASALCQVVQTWDPEDNFVGSELVRGTTSLVVAATEMPPPVGLVLARQFVTKAVIGAEYPPVAGMVALQSTQVVCKAPTASNYLSVDDTFSVSRYAFTNTMFTLRAPGAFYPDPDDMYQAAAFQFTAQVFELVTQRRVTGALISQAPAAQVLMAATQRAIYPPPDSMLGDGVSARLVLSQSLRVSDYPPLDMPDSDLLVSLAVSQLLVGATYPPADAANSDAVVSLVGQQVAVTAGFPPKDAILSNARVSATIQQVISSSIYGDKSDVLSYARSCLVVAQVATLADYLSKDVAQSFSVCRLAVEQVASVALYSPPSLVGSAVRASSVVSQVMSRDTSLYGAPVLPPRRRPVVITRYVW